MHITSFEIGVGYYQCKLPTTASDDRTRNLHSIITHTKHWTPHCRHWSRIKRGVSWLYESCTAWITWGACRMGSAGVRSVSPDGSVTLPHPHGDSTRERTFIWGAVLMNLQFQQLKEKKNPPIWQAYGLHEPYLPSRYSTYIIVGYNTESQSR